MAKKTAKKAAKRARDTGTAPAARATKKKKPATRDRKSADVLRPEAGEVIVRMYRHGLGDCFLLAFGSPGKRDPRYVLVDCGVHMRQTKGTARLLQVMDSLTRATGHHLHVVVATHEHADHLSGFVQKQSPFLKDSLTIDQLWVGWTEKVGDSQADLLRKKRGSARAVIEKAVQEARDKAAQQSVSRLADRIDDVMRFEGHPEAFDDKDRDAVLSKIKALARKRPHGSDSLARFSPGSDETAADGLGAATTERKPPRPSSNELAMELLKVKADAIYCEPADVRLVPDIDNVRAFVLGPPRMEKLLKKDRPTKVRGGHEHEYQETYLSGGTATQVFAASPALDGDGSGSGLPEDLMHPFSHAYRRSPGPDGEYPRLASTESFFRQYYLDEDESWRKIDDDWLGAAEQLALNLDSDTNNTSLTLAFELGEPGVGPVLLFAADAQVGNWLSWRDQSYVAAGKTMSADDLLRRTLIYKCGHHGSHNATVKRDPRDASVEDGVPFGLELMNDIIAMIPVDRAAADKKMPTPWRMPHRPLYTRIREKANRRVLRGDLVISPLDSSEPDDIRPSSTDWSPVPGKRGLTWRAAKEQFQGEGTAGPLYFDIRIRYQ